MGLGLGRGLIVILIPVPGLGRGGLRPQSVAGTGEATGTVSVSHVYMPALPWKHASQIIMTPMFLTIAVIVTCDLVLTRMSMNGTAQLLA